MCLCNVVWVLTCICNTNDFIFVLVPATAPVDLTPVPKKNDPRAVIMNWQPPAKPNGQITGELPPPSFPQVDRYLVSSEKYNTCTDVYILHKSQLCPEVNRWVVDSLTIEWIQDNGQMLKTDLWVKTFHIRCIFFCFFYIRFPVLRRRQSVFTYNSCLIPLYEKITV